MTWMAVMFLVGVDAGSPPARPIRFAHMPQWSATEPEARSIWGRLRPSAGVEGDDPSWREQDLDETVLGVPITRVFAYFDRHSGLRRAYFTFAESLGAPESSRRETLAAALRRAFGPPTEEGGCYAIWQTELGKIVLERGQVGIVAPEDDVANVDAACRRLLPVAKPYHQKDSTPIQGDSR